MDADVEERFARLEGVVDALAGHAKHLDDHVERLDGVMTALAEANIQTLHRINALAEETKQRFRETDERIRALADQIAQTDAHLKQTGERLDERIDHLVSAIGELIRRQPRAS